MTEENSVSTEPETEAVPSPKVASAPRHEVREAEHKLKEMSRKAKERKTAHNASKQSKGLSEINYFWLVIGGLGALGVGYLVFGKKDPDRREPPKPRPRFKGQRPVAYAFVPKPNTPVKEPPVEKEDSVPKFELNCF